MAAILNVGDNTSDILVIIKNYTGDRLNFGLAIEKARNTFGYENIELLICDDDCAIEKVSHSTGKRGLCGVILLHKIAGAMSAIGRPLLEITLLCRNLLASRLLRTIGFSFHLNHSNEFVDIEIGKGIHGEPGCFQMKSEKNVNRIIEILIEKLKFSEIGCGEIVLLFNNLGGTSQYVFTYFQQQFIEGIKGFNLKVAKIYAGEFLTSLNKEGISVTVLELKNPEIMKYLEYPIDVPSGHLFKDSFNHQTANVSDYMMKANVRTRIDNPLVSEEETIKTFKIIKAVGKDMVGLKDSLNEIDILYGDGDTGTQFAAGGKAMLINLKDDKLNLNDPECLMQQLSDILMESMGGSSGALFSIFFQCASKAFNDKNCNSVHNWLQAIKLGNNGIMLYGKANVGDRTMLDALKTGEMKLEQYYNDTISKEISLIGALNAFHKGCDEGAVATLKMMPKSGRAAYCFLDKPSDYKFESTSQDPGAYGISALSGSMCFDAIHESSEFTTADLQFINFHFSQCSSINCA